MSASSCDTHTSKRCSTSCFQGRATSDRHVAEGQRNTGGALGFAGLTGVAVTLDTYQNGGDVSANFVGIGRSAPDTDPGQVTYVAQRRVPTPLTQGTHSVDVTVTAGRLTAVVDGTVTLSGAVTVPPQAYLAFSAGTGGLTDVHTVRDVVIRRPAPSGAVTSATGPCLASTNTGQAALATCGTSPQQRWTAGGDGTLVALDRCLDSIGTAPGSGVDVAACNGSAAQVWTASSGGTLVQQATGLCLVATRSATPPRTALSLATCHATVAAQRWTLPG